jgi:hypothetical protein
VWSWVHRRQGLLSVFSNQQRDLDASLSRRAQRGVVTLKVACFVQHA